MAINITHTVIRGKTYPADGGRCYVTPKFSCNRINIECGAGGAATEAALDSPNER